MPTGFPLLSQTPELHRSKSKHDDGTPFRPFLYWTSIVLVCASLGASGLVRTWQDRRLADAVRLSEPAPFPLKDLPVKLPGWSYIDATEQRLDPQVAKIAGSSDHLIRTYVDESTGVSLTVLVIYGNGQLLSTHVPEVCYPNVGYTAVDEVFDSKVPIGPSGSGQFRSLVFAKTGGVVTDREEVYYSFRHEGQWYPDAAVDWKRFRHNPSMFKVQVQRRIAEHEHRLLRRATDKVSPSPSEQFLTVFLEVLERRIAASRSPGAAGPVPSRE